MPTIGLVAGLILLASDAKLLYDLTRSVLRMD